MPPPPPPPPELAALAEAEGAALWSDAARIAKEFTSIVGCGIAKAEAEAAAGICTIGACTIGTENARGATATALAAELRFT